jgi:DNA-binding response OmpR family regulator
VATQTHEPSSTGEGAGPPMTVVISADVGERLRAIQGLDPSGVVIMAPSREVAVRLLAAGAPTSHPPGGLSDQEVDHEVIALGDLVIDRDRAAVAWNGHPLELTHLEIEVLACLGETPGRVWSYERLHRAAWRTDYVGDRDSLHSLIKRLRRKLRSANVAIDLQAVRGIGFQLILLRAMTTFDLPV